MSDIIPSVTETKVMEFIQKISIPFSYLSDQLKDKIFNTLVEREFNDKDFEVLKILDFTILEMIIKGENNIECKIKVKGECNNPIVGEKLLISPKDKYKILHDTNVLYFENGKVQILAKLKNRNYKAPFIIKIETKKKITSNIICTANIDN